MQFYDNLWKSELNSFLNEFINTTRGDFDDADRYFVLERPLLYSAFIVRKLIEDSGVTDGLKQCWLEVGKHASLRNGEPIFLEAIVGPLEVQDHFNLEERTTLRISYNDLASEIIHSEGLAWKSGDDGIVSFVVFSYRNALNRLIDVRVDQYKEMLQNVISDQPTEWTIEKNLRTGTITRHAV